MPVRDVEDARANPSDLDLAVLNILLKDRSTGKNIVWVTDEHAKAFGYAPEDELTWDKILWGIPINPRFVKNIVQQKARTRKRGEVFTPGWVIQQMIDCMDNDWFEEDREVTWKRDASLVPMKQRKVPKGKTWQDYVKATCLEICCGEGAFITSRYEQNTGERISFWNRYGILDRKLQMCILNTEHVEDTLEWMLIALQSTYGYELQGDSLYLARVNALCTFFDAALVDMAAALPGEDEE